MHGNVARSDDQEGAQGFPHEVLIDAFGQLIQMFVLFDQSVQGRAGGFEVFDHPPHRTPGLADGSSVILGQGPAEFLVVFLEFGPHVEQKAGPPPAWGSLSRFERRGTRLRPRRGLPGSWRWAALRFPRPWPGW